jgi:ubiquitin C-terminal hydrolase
MFEMDLTTEEEFQCPNCLERRGRKNSGQVITLADHLIFKVTPPPSDSSNTTPVPSTQTFKYSRKLDLTEYLPTAQYKLQAVVVGKEDEGYKLFAKRRHSWYQFDDNTAFKVRLKEVLKSTNPAVLLYEKLTSDEQAKLGRQVKFGSFGK